MRRKLNSCSFINPIDLQVGCDGHLWKHQTQLMKQLRKQAKDGTLAEVLQLPVLLWRVRADSSLFSRNRREAGSGDYGNSDDYGYDDDYDGDYDEDDEDGETDNEDALTEHPHRHHHGEETIDWKVKENKLIVTI